MLLLMLDGWTLEEGVGGLVGVGKLGGLGEGPLTLYPDWLGSGAAARVATGVLGGAVMAGASHWNPSENGSPQEPEGLL